MGSPICLILIVHQLNPPIMPPNEQYRYKGFKLISLSLKDNSLTGFNPLTYDFIEPDDPQKSIYTTVIIGPNGTGKSNLFRIIIELLKEISDLSQGRNRTYAVDGTFHLKFSVNGDVFEYGNQTELSDIISYSLNENTKIYLLRNDAPVNFLMAQFPIAIVANSIMLTDKYPFFRKVKNEAGERVEAFPQYKYLGVRNIAQSASTRAYVRRTVEFIVEQFDSKAFRDGLKRITDFLELPPAIRIFYYTSNTNIFFSGELSENELNSYFKEIRKKYPTSEDNPPFKLNHYLRIRKDQQLLKRICNFCNDLVKFEGLKELPYKSSIRKISYNILDKTRFKDLKEDFELLEHLRQLGIISTPEIELSRRHEYSLQESSSGEYHFFSTMVGLMATVKTNSLVFIDEPEVSLHPNWQMKYLSFIREIFRDKEYATSHIVIATHSHFIISDLKSDSSKILGLKRTKESIETIPFPRHFDTFGWSAEDVLYNVFNVRSSLNYYLEADLTELLGMIANNENKPERMREILSKLNNLPKRDHDPMQDIIKEATEYLESIN
jgi:predicted ATPase